MGQIIITEKNNKILFQENNLQAVWMCAALEVMYCHKKEHLSFGWAFNFKDYAIADVALEYISNSNHSVILIFEKNYITFEFRLSHPNNSLNRCDLIEFKKMIAEKYNLPSLKIDLIASYMDNEILREKNEELEKNSKSKDKNDWLNSFNHYGFLDMSVEKLSTMKIPYDPMGIYILRDLDNGKRYVGQGKKVLTRALEHFKENADDDVSKAYKSGHKFVVERIITGYKDGSDFCLNQVEALFIHHFDSVHSGYNKTRGNVKGTQYTGTKLASQKRACERKSVNADLL